MAAITIHLRLLEPIEAELVTALTAALARRFDAPVIVENTILSLEFAWVRKRNQYNSTSILRNLKATAINDRSVLRAALLAVVDRDLYSEGLTFVFGEAEVSGTVALISLARLRPSFVGAPDNQAILTQRAITEAVHELGHVLGLHHCEKPRCVMYFSQTLDDTDQKSDQFCGDCAQILAESSQ